jgi:hypothetical protein
MTYKRVFLIGNGPSRKNFDLNSLTGKGFIVGCNALYRDFSPDMLVAIDSKMINEFRRNNVKIPIIHRSNYRTKFFNSSGIFGLRYILEMLEPKICYLLGMDFAPGNVYFATSNYRNHLKLEWIREKKFFLKALKQFSKTEVVHVMDKRVFNNLDPKIYNYRHITYKEFKDEIQIT